MVRAAMNSVRSTREPPIAADTTRRRSSIDTYARILA
jgi:hypothetical protein